MLDVQLNDTVRVDLAIGKVLDPAKFEASKVVMMSGENNIGRVGTVANVRAWSRLPRSAAELFGCA